MTLSLTPGRVGGDYWAWMALGAAAHALCGLLLFSSRRCLSALPGVAQPLAVLAVIAGSGCARGAFLGLVTAALGWAEDSHLGVRIPAAAVSFTFWFALSAILVDGTRRHRDAMRDIRSGLTTQQAALTRSAHQAADLRTDALEQTRRVVTDQLQRAVTLSSEPARAAAHLHEVVDSVVRPLSHALQEQAMVDDRLRTSVHAVDRQALPLRLYLDRLASPSAFRPLVAATIVVATAASLAFLLLGPRVGILGLGLAGAVVAVSLKALRSAMAPALERSGLRMRSAVVLASWLATAALGGSVMMALVAQAGAWPTELTQNPDAQRVLSWSVSSLLVLTATAGAAAERVVRASRAEAESRLREVTEQARWSSARLRQSTWVQQQQLARLLHGEAQARIVSLALQLQLNPPADVGGAIATLSADINRRLGQDHLGDWQEALAQTKILWARAIDLDITVDASAQAALIADPTAARATAEVMRESITNAVRHGAARHVLVRIQVEGSMIIFEADDDGAGIHEPMAAGMGHAMMDAVCLEWALIDGPSGRLRAALPVVRGVPVQREVAHA